MPLIMPSPRTGIMPKIHDSVFIAPTAVIIGDVTIKEHASVWFGSVLRGDIGSIKIGKNVCIQDMVTIHNEEESFVIIGDDCTIGHHAMIHGPCIIEEGCLVGIASNVLHESKLGKGSLLGAGAVLVNKEIPPFCLVVGIPARVKKEIPKNEPLVGIEPSQSYIENGKAFKVFFEKNLQYLDKL